MTASPFTMFCFLLQLAISTVALANPLLHRDSVNLLAELPQEAFYHSEIIPYADDIKQLYADGESDNFSLEQRSTMDWVVQYKKASEPTFRIRRYVAERKTYVCIKTMYDSASFMGCWSDKKEVAILPDINTSFFLSDSSKFTTSDLMKYTMVDKTFDMNGDILIRGLYVLYGSKIKSSDFAYDGVLKWNPKGDGAFELSRQKSE